MFVNNVIPSFLSIQSYIPPIDIASTVIISIIITILFRKIAKQYRISVFVAHLPQSHFSVIQLDNLMNIRSTNYLHSSETSYQNKAVCNCISSITQLAFCSRSALSSLRLFVGHDRKWSFLPPLSLCFLFHSPHYISNANL